MVIDIASKKILCIIYYYLIYVIFFSRFGKTVENNNNVIKNVLFCCIYNTALTKPQIERNIDYKQKKQF